jgi:hypothetical protein
MRKSAWLAWSAGIVSILTVVLILLGFGVGLAVERRFGLPTTQTYGSTLDLVGYGALAIASLLSNFGPTHWRASMLPATIASTWPAMLGVAGAWSIVVVAYMARRRWRWVVRLRAWSIARSASMAERPLMRVTLAVALVLASLPLAVPVVAWIALAACAVMAVVPMIGMAAGEAHFVSWVLGPTQCHPSMTLQEHRAMAKFSSGGLAVVPCVSIRRSGDATLRGRVLLATSNAILLFDPVTGSVQRVPVDGAVVETWEQRESAIAHGSAVPRPSSP